MYYDNESDFDRPAWHARLESAKTSDEFLLLLRELPTEQPMNDDEVIERFKGEETWESIDGAENMLRWCWFWFFAHWCLPVDQQARCTARLMQEAGYPIGQELEATPLNKSLRRWHSAILEHSAE